MSYIVNITDIEAALVALGGESTTRKIQDRVLADFCRGQVPENYQSHRTFRQTIQRIIEDHCPQAAGFDAARKDIKFLRVAAGVYRTSAKVEELEFTSPDEVLPHQELYEGAIKTIAVNVYERNKAARQLCIERWGWSCIACGFNFEKTYGRLGAAYVHVHHVKPLAEIRESYEVNPIEDLRPICANCHAIVHRSSPALTIDQLKRCLKSNC